MVGKQLSALLQILRASGVTRYQTNALTLELAPRPVAAAGAGRTVNVSPEALDADREEEDEGDPRFLLERLTKRHFPAVKADPRRNKATES